MFLFEIVNFMVCEFHLNLKKKERERKSMSRRGHSRHHGGKKGRQGSRVPDGCGVGAGPGGSDSRAWARRGGGDQRQKGLSGPFGASHAQDSTPELLLRSF